jgi:hypothetical protein
LLKGNAIGKMDDAAGRHNDVLGIAAVTMLAYHLAMNAELLVTDCAIVALATCYHIVDAHAIACFDLADLDADLFDRAGYFVPKCDRSPADRRGAGAIVGIGMADAGSLDANEDIVAT